MDAFSQDTIRKLPIFHNLKETTLQKIISKGHIYYYHPGETIFLDRDELSSILFVLDGIASLYKAHNNGQNKIIFMLSNGVLIKLPLTITVLADFLGSYRETTSRALKHLVQDHLIIYENKHTIVPDPDKLALYIKNHH